MLPCTVILPTKSNEDDDVFVDRLVGIFSIVLRYSLKHFFSIKLRLSAKDQGMWDGFINSVNARMNVAKIVDELRQDAALTFDFVVLIVIAG